eukprot:3131196-Rhodomonas_salina.1
MNRPPRTLRTRPRAGGPTRRQLAHRFSAPDSSGRCASACRAYATFLQRGSSRSSATLCACSPSASCSVCRCRGCCCCCSIVAQPDSSMRQSRTLRSARVGRHAAQISTGHC